MSVWMPDNGIVMIPNRYGDTLTPSVVGLDDTGQVIVGKSARERLLTHPDQTVALIKRHMGEDVSFLLGEEVYRPEELSAYILKSLKQDAETYLGEEVTQCMISVPAYFTNVQRQATQAAAKIAGLEVVRLINEPTAAALAYGIQEETDCQYLVLDLGGGTFDVTLLDYFETVLSVNSSSGDKKLGGEDFTLAIVDYIVQNIQVEESSLSAKDRIKIRNAAEYLKHSLSDHEEVETRIQLEAGEQKIMLSRFTFMRISEELLNRIKKTIIRTIRDAEVKLDEIEKVILVGGSSRIAIYKDFIKSLLKKEPELKINIDESICVGVTVAVELKNENPAFGEVILTDVAPHSLGIEISKRTSHGWASGVFSSIIDRNSFVPCSFEKSYSTIEPYQPSIQFDIYQGESLEVKQNLKIGSLTIPLTPKQETQSATVRFTYDINGVLLVDIQSDETGHSVQSVLIQNESMMKDLDVTRSISKLQEIKKENPFESTNEHLLAWASRLYQEVPSHYAYSIENAIMEFKAILENGSLPLKKKAQRQLKDFLQQMEQHTIDVLS
ncbi:Hsp70 family protein [Fulvivirga maritima]|nr:Hsp70 family protein [Fulvivirga maritima]UII25116.1 Hsp70 family protein [Fulvivirga maritima]